MKRRVIAMLIALSVSISGMPTGVLAEEEFTESIIVDSEEIAEGEETSIEEMYSESADMDVLIADLEETAEGEDKISEEIILDSEDAEVEMEENALLLALEDESEGLALKQTTVGGSTYAFVDVSDVNDKENQAYILTVSGRGGITTTYYTFTDLKQLVDSDFYYVVTAGTDLAGETVYAYTGDAAHTSTYTGLYQSIGVSAEGIDYDVISSATHYSGYHAKDISGTVIYGTDSDGNKAITGVSYGRGTEAIDGNAYVKAMLLSAAGEELSDAQTALCGKKLKANPTVAPTSDTKKVSLASASFATSKYGFGEFDIVPDDSVSGYVWNEYWDNVYGATVSDGSTTVGAVHWIDLYGEAATSGPHYNKIQLALNSGTSAASNAVEVHRYDAFVENGALKPAVYTVTIYAEGYENLTASVDLRAESSITLKDTVSVYSGKAVLPEKELIGNEESVSYTYYSDAECTKVLSKTPVDAGIYYVVASLAEDQNYLASVSNTAKLVIEKKAATIKTKDASLSKTYKLAKTKKAAKKFAISASVDSKGKLTCKKVSGHKSLKIDKNGKITFAKTAKKGTYKMKVKISSAEMGNYMAASKTVTVKVVVK